MIPLLRRDLTDALEVRVRAIRLGFWLTPKRQAIIYNRCRGELTLYVCGRLPASVEQVREALQLVDEWVDAHDLTDTQAMLYDTAPFIARDTFERRLSIHLAPASSLLQPISCLMWQTDTAAPRLCTSCSAQIDPGRDQFDPAWHKLRALTSCEAVKETAAARQSAPLSPRT